MSKKEKSQSVTDGLGRALRMRRAELGDQQQEVAKRAGITPAMLSSYESEAESPRLKTPDAILVALNMNLADLARIMGQLPAAPSEEPALGGRGRLGAILELAVLAAIEDGDIDREMLARLKQVANRTDRAARRKWWAIQLTLCILRGGIGTEHLRWMESQLVSPTALQCDNNCQSPTWRCSRRMNNPIH